MAISNHIIQLVAEALKDKVLTTVEKQTIIAEAMSQGISFDEVNGYITNALKVRLQHYAKEDLKKCPHCGAQIPLVSDVCLFCDQSLKGSGDNTVSTADIRESGDNYTKSQNLHPCPQCGAPNTLNAKKCFACGTKLRALDDAFNIIQRENQSTAEEQTNIKNCPNCGAPFPLVSNICPHCQHVLHEQTDSEHNIRQLLGNITQSINMLKTMRKPTFGMVLKFRISVVLFYFAASLLIIGQLGATQFHEGCNGLSMLILFISLGLLYFTHKNNDNSPVQQADNLFYNALHNYEMYARQTETIYGDNAEARKLLDNFSSEIEGYKKSRSKNRKNIAILTLCLLALPIVIHLIAPKGKDEYLEDRAKFPIPYEMLTYSKTLQPLPSGAVYGWSKDYITVKGDVELMIDADAKNYRIETSDRASATAYRFNVGPIRVASTGKSRKGADTCLFGLALFDKNQKRVAKNMGPFLYCPITDYDNVNVVIKFGCGECYTEFASKQVSVDAEMMKQIADSAYYFVIF
ncbi:MAG: zinc ribbon domain-containing protein [Bacteroidales bacterium]|nr:zinc ribbon domain-containing protein [Bacteroidales bacterium]